MAFARAPGYSNTVLEGRSWRVYSLKLERDAARHHIAWPIKYRGALLSRTLRAMALALLFALVLLTALTPPTPACSNGC